VKEAAPNEHHKSILRTLRTPAAKSCEIEQINFVVDSRRSVVASNFYTKFKKLGVQEQKKKKSSLMV